MGWIRRTAEKIAKNVAETAMPHLSEDGWRRQMTYEELMRLGSADSSRLAATMRRDYPELYRLSQPEHVVRNDLRYLESQGRVKITADSRGTTTYEVVR